MIQDPPEMIQKIAAGLVGSLIFPTPVGDISTGEFFAGTHETVTRCSGLPGPLAAMAATTLCAWLDDKGYITLVDSGAPPCDCGSGICDKNVTVSAAGRRWVTSLVPPDTFASDEELGFDDSPPWE